MTCMCRVNVSQSFIFIFVISVRREGVVLR